MSEEIWKKVKGFEKYEVSSMGRARSYNKTSNTYRILNPCMRNKKKKPDDYLRIYIKGSFYTLHELIAETFEISNPDNKPEINHKNGIKTDNRVDNLEWMTRSENIQHSYENNLHKTGKDHKQAKPLYVYKDGELITTLYGNKEWKAFGLDQSSVNQCCRGERKHYKGYTFKKE